MKVLFICKKIFCGFLSHLETFLPYKHITNEYKKIFLKKFILFFIKFYINITFSIYQSNTQNDLEICTVIVEEMVVIVITKCKLVGFLIVDTFSIFFIIFIHIR